MKTFKSYTHICKHCIHDIKEDNKFVIDDYALLCKIIDKSNTTVYIERKMIGAEGITHAMISVEDFNHYYNLLTDNDIKELIQIAKF